MSIKDRISAFERGPVQAVAVSPSPSAPAAQSNDLASREDHACSTIAAARRRAEKAASSSGGASDFVGPAVGHGGAERGGLESAGSLSLGLRPAPISRTLSASSLTSNGSGQSSTRTALRTLGEMVPGQRPSPTSPKLARSEILSLYQPGSPRASSSRPLSPSGPTLASPSLSLGGTTDQPASSSDFPITKKPPPPLPQRQATLLSASASSTPAARPPPIASKPAHLSKSQPATQDLLWQTSETSRPQQERSEDRTSSSVDVSGGTTSREGPRATGFIARGHKPTLSTSSMNSVNLDYDPEPPAPAAHRSGPPALPSRKSTASSTSSVPPPLPARKPTLPTTPQPSVVRRQPPPALHKRLDSTPSSFSLPKPHSVNSPARSRAPSEAALARYSALFTQLLSLRRVAKIKMVMTGKADGWAGGDEREGWLQGVVVRRVWERSRLPPDVLRGIWDAVDPDGSGLLDRPSFERGMGLVDQELLARRRSPASRS